MTDPQTAQMWDDFCSGLSEKLRHAGSQVLTRAGSDLDRLEGLRVMLRDLRISLERNVEHIDATHPFFGDVYNDTFHLIGDTPDYVMRFAMVEPEHTYVIEGLPGAADTFNFTSQGPAEGSADPVLWLNLVDPDAHSEITGTLDIEDVELEPDGTFRIVVSKDKPSSGNWLPLGPRSTMILVRDEFRRRWPAHRRHSPSKLDIRRLDDVGGPVPLAEAPFSSALARVVHEVGTASVNRGQVVENFAARGVGRFDSNKAFWKLSGANPRTTFIECYWELAPGEALVIELQNPPQAASWIAALTNAWMETLDFRFAQIYVNSTYAEYGADGSLQLVIAHEDPGIPNWLDTIGHNRGVLMWRWNYPASYPEVTRSEVVSLADFRARQQR